MFFKDPTTRCLLETHFSSKDTQVQNEGMEDNILSKQKPKESSCSHIRQNRLHAKNCYKRQRRSLYKDKEGHFIMIKQSIHQEDITTLRIYPSNTQASKYANANKY